MKRYKVIYFHPLYRVNKILIADGEINISDGYACFYSGNDGWLIPEKWIIKITDCETGNEMI